jgi:hypothetical protein
LRAPAAHCHPRGGVLLPTNPHMRRVDGRSPEKRIADTQRQAEALDLYRSGKTYQQIADALGYANKSGAWWAVDRALVKIVKPAGDEVLKMELARLDRMQNAVDDKAMAGDVPAILACVRIMERRAKYLGLDAPVKLAGADGGAIKVEDVTPTAARKAIAELFGEHVVAPPSSDFESGAAPDDSGARKGPTH